MLHLLVPSLRASIIVQYADLRSDGQCFHSEDFSSNFSNRVVETTMRGDSATIRKDVKHCTIASPFDFVRLYSVESAVLELELHVLGQHSIHNHGG